MEDQNQTDKNSEIVETNNYLSQANNGLEPISFFKKDKSFVFAHQKIEKLVAAVYMITNFLPSEEPIKWTLRNLCMKMLHLNIDLKNSQRINQMEKERELRELSLEIVSLLEVGMFAGLVSSMNLSILKKEFHGLLEHVDKTLSRQNVQNTLVVSPLHTNDERELFSRGSDPHGATFYRDVSQDTAHVSKKSGIGAIKDKNGQLSNDLYVPEVADPIPSQRISQKTPKLSEFGPVAVKKNKRQSIIISLLKKKKEIMVKDVSEIVGDCSEKTIQRELSSLVSQGILGKVGERRWTRYHLAIPG